MKKDSFILDFLAFGLKEAVACVFAGVFFLLLFLSHRLPLFGLPRYDRPSGPGPILSSRI